MVTLNKINEAKNIIKEAIDTYKSRCYIAYSGGKDSKAMVKLAKSIYPDVLIIHNEHPGESVEDIFGLLIVRQPKTQVKDFLKFVKLDCQIDGTRRDEDKNVIFDGIDIHRSQMPTYKTSNGVFGLAIYYPFVDWTEEEVYDYLNNY